MGSQLLTVNLMNLQSLKESLIEGNEIEYSQIEGLKIEHAISPEYSVDERFTKFDHMLAMEI